jgi:hypothetical protein
METGWRTHLKPARRQSNATMPNCAASSWRPSNRVWKQLQEQVEHLDLNAHNLNRVLPEAIALRGETDHRLTHALTPHVSEALGVSVRKQPHMIVDAIAPIMMPAIRQAIANALRSMVQSLNQTIEHSLSIRSMQWRLEALRTGKPFAEIVLLHTLCYRVEQVFLIHAQTGLLLAHAAGDAVAVQDQTLVSGMLSAIRSFVQDSFGATPDQALNTLQVGDLTVWIEQGPSAILAAVIRGTPPCIRSATAGRLFWHVSAQNRDSCSRPLRRMEGIIDSPGFATRWLRTLRPCCKKAVWIRGTSQHNGAPTTRWTRHSSSNVPGSSSRPQPPFNWPWRGRA